MRPLVEDAMFDLQCPKGWRMVTLSDLGEVNRGRSRHRPRYAEHLYGGPYPFIQTGDIKAARGRIREHTQTYSEAGLAQSRLWPAGTMCITIAANIAETALLTYPACFPDSVIGFIADESKGGDGLYIEYVFRQLRERIQGITARTGTAQDNINLEFLERLKFPVPPLPTQRAIAGVLGALDDKIEVNRKTARVLEGIARAVFTSWFVDFDPVRYNIRQREHAALGRAGRFISTGDDITFRDPGGKVVHHAGDAVYGPIAHLFPDRLVDSAIGKVPEGWKVGTLGQVVSRVAMGPFGSSIKTDNFVPDGVPIVRGGNLTNGFMDRDFVYLTEAKADELKNANAFPGDVVITHRGTLGQVGLIPLKARHKRYVVSQSQMLIRPSPALPSHYLYLYLTSVIGQHSLLANVSQTGVPAIAQPTTSLKAIRMLCPSPALLAVFEQHAAGIFAAIVSRDHQSAALAALRDALLPKLISGELRTAEAERIIARTPEPTACRS
jgi:type I restriction enzyme, S subunit